MSNDENDRWAENGDLPINYIRRKAVHSELSNNDTMSKEGVHELKDSTNNKLIYEQKSGPAIRKSEPIIQKSEPTDQTFDFKEFGETVRKLDKILSQVAESLQLVADQRKKENLQTYSNQKGAEAISKGLISVKKYRNYYDVSKTIATAAPDDPHDFDSPVYQRERIFVDLQRIADKILVTNEGPGILYIIVSHGGEIEFSQETPIFAGDTKWYYNVYELRTRSPIAGLAYRVTEYDIHVGGSIGFTPFDMVDMHDVALPAANTNWLPSDITPINTPTDFRIQVAVSISGNFDAAITNGGDTQVVTFNVIPGPALVAGGLYIFDLLVHSGDTVNLRYSTTGGTIQILRVQEIDSASA